MSGKPKTAKIAYELRKLRKRGAVKKIQNSHYYRLTEEVCVWLYYTLFNYSRFISPLLSKHINKAVVAAYNNPSQFEEAYSMIDAALSSIIKGFDIAA